MTVAMETRIAGLRDKFAAAWDAGFPPRIEEYLVGLPSEATTDDHHLLLEALVQTDILHRWQVRRGASPSRAERSPVGPEDVTQAAPDSPLLEDYVAHFPGLGPVEGLSDSLIAQEYRARRLAGDNPGIAEYAKRFAVRGGEVSRLIESTEAGLRESPGTPRTAGGSGELGANGVPGWVPQLPHYEFESVLGHGGMGIVLKARDTLLRRTVAIKFPKILSGVGEERFMREARTLAPLRHPNICPIYELGEKDGWPFIVMGFIQGETLRERLVRDRPTPRLACELVVKVARAVAYAHGHNVLHRDIKPGNVMIDAESGEPVLTDFGLAREIEMHDSQLTRPEEMLGTPAYMAPEQVGGEADKIGPLTDVYALGVLLYELMMGRRPFEGPVGAVLQALQSEEPVAPRRLVPRLHRDLETICLKAMAKDPAGRYGSAQALAEDLGRFLEGEMILARRMGPLGRVGRRMARHPWVSAGARRDSFATFSCIPPIAASDQSPPANSVSNSLRSAVT